MSTCACSCSASSSRRGFVIAAPPTGCSRSRTRGPSTWSARGRRADGSAADLDHERAHLRPEPEASGGAVGHTTTRMVNGVYDVSWARTGTRPRPEPRETRAPPRQARDGARESRSARPDSKRRHPRWQPRPNPRRCSASSGSSRQEPTSGSPGAPQGLPGLQLRFHLSCCLARCDRRAPARRWFSRCCCPPRACAAPCQVCSCG